MMKNSRCCTILTFAACAVAIAGTAIPQTYPKQDVGRVQEGDFVLRVVDGRFRMFLVEPSGPSSDIGDLTTIIPIQEYKCDNDPPQEGDSCTCGNTGKGGVADILDCGWLAIDCVDGAYNDEAGSCSNWDGDPLPDLP